MRKFLLSSALLCTASAALAQGVPVSGEVTKLDTAQNKITLKHSAIPNLEMDAMTMVFVAGDPEMLKAVKAGDKVTFEADRVNGRLTVTKIQKSK